MPEPTPIELLAFIKETFDWEELKTLCFQLYVPFDDLAGTTREAKARELITYMQRVGRLPVLLAALARERPQQYRQSFDLSPQTQPKRAAHTRNPRQVFISHAHQDAKFAHRLADDLRRENYEVWIAPDSIPLGERWVEAINRALRESGIFLLVSTPDAVDSEWVQDETNYAVELATKRRVRFIRLVLKEADVPPLWTVRQHVSFRGDYKTGLKLLFSALELPTDMVQTPKADALPADPSTDQGKAESQEVDRLVEPPQVEPPEVGHPKEELLAVESAASDVKASTGQTSEQELEPEQKSDRTEPGTPAINIPSLEPKPKARKRRKQVDPKNTTLTNPTGTKADVPVEKVQLSSEYRIETTEQSRAMPADAKFDEEPIDVGTRPTRLAETNPLIQGNPSTPTLISATLDAELSPPSSTALVGEMVELVTEPSSEESPKLSSGKIDDPLLVDAINADYSSTESLDRSLINPNSTVSEPFQESADFSSEVDSAKSIEVQSSPNSNRAGYVALAILFLLGGLGVLCSYTDFNYSGGFYISTPEATGAGQEASVTATHEPSHEPQTRSVSLPGGLEVEQVFVPAGSFMMGSEDFSNAQPVHYVRLDAFWIGRTEVTNAQYGACISAGACRPPSDDSSNTRESYFGNPYFADYPVVNVTWEDARAFSEWAGGRLPTEAEWEYAAGGPESFTYPWGDEPPSCERLNFSGCIDDTSEAGSYPDGASWVGALDMAGNVWEWVNDWYATGYHERSPAVNPTGPDSGNFRVVRGGSWNDIVQFTRAAYRYYYLPDLGDLNVGFRVVEPLSDPYP